MTRRTQLNVLLAACLLVAAVAGTAVPGTLYVPGDYETIQEAIDAAVSGQDQIEVAPGTYYEGINFLGKAVRLYSSGGPAVTTIDATGLVGVYHVVQCVNWEGPDTVLEGFTITGGNANGPTLLDACGGGMYNSDSSPTVTDCTFTSNSAEWLGGGMLNDYSSSPTVTNCTFSGNSAEYCGGGMFNDDSSSPSVTNCTFSGNSAGGGGGMFNAYSSPTVTNCTFSGNSAGDGGGMDNSDSYAIVTDCTFSNNTAALGGAMSNWNASSPEVTNCTFSGNAGADKGGGMYNQASSPRLAGSTFTGNTADYGGGMCNWNGSDPTVTNCTFSSNTADEGGGMLNRLSDPSVTECTLSANTAARYGGGMENVESSPAVTNCIFRENAAADYGGGMENGGSSPTVTNCTFSGNRADYGGGMDNYFSSQTVTNCTFSGNSASGGAGGMYCESSSIYMDNCILWGDTPTEIEDWDSSLAVSYSNVQGGWPGTDNIDADPMFADGDGRLSTFSPCIDAGDNDVVWEDTDLDGNPRITDGNGDGDAKVDMGAYEFQGSAVDLMKYLAGAVDALNLPEGIANSLDAKLHAAAKKLTDANETNDVAGINELGAFINAVQAQRGKKIPEADADALIGRAQRIMTMLQG